MPLERPDRRPGNLTYSRKVSGLIKQVGALARTTAGATLVPLRALPRVLPLVLRKMVLGMALDREAVRQAAAGRLGGFADHGCWPRGRGRSSGPVCAPAPRCAEAGFAGR